MQKTAIFQGPPRDRINSRAGVVFDPAGNLYGTTCDGGVGTETGCAAGNSGGAGIVFEITPKLASPARGLSTERPEKSLMLVTVHAPAVLSRLPYHYAAPSIERPATARRYGGDCTPD